MPLKNCHLDPGVSIPHPELVNLYGCRIGQQCQIGPFVEIQSDVVIGARCKISSHSFICSGVTLEDEVFVGHGVMFTNDLFPSSVNEDGTLKAAGDWACKTTYVGRGASIGSNATILCGVRIGDGALIGAGSVVTKCVADGAVVAGVPARALGNRIPKALSRSHQSRTTVEQLP